MPTANRRPWHKLYATALWQRLRAAQLRREPLCRDCHALGHLVPATHADHVIPHKGDWSLFKDPDNLQSLCGPCHSRKTNYLDGGFGHERNEQQMNRGCDVNGMPLDAAHPWRQEDRGRGSQMSGTSLHPTTRQHSRDIPQIKNRPT